MTERFNRTQSAAVSVGCGAPACRSVLSRVACCRFFVLGIISAAMLLAAPASYAQAWFERVGEPMSGAARAAGAIIWSHGRSLDTEDYTTPTPPYLAALRAGGWDVFRFNRMRASDTLVASAEALAEGVHVLKQNGYRRIAVAGQSFGGFLSLMAADASDEIDAVIATAPAAFGDSAGFPDSWQANATKLYPLLWQVRRARVMMFYFQDDNFDPGGRGGRSRDILEERHLNYVVVDRPPALTGHWAAGTPLFAQVYSACMLAFLGDRPFDAGAECSDTPSSRAALAGRRAPAPSPTVGALVRQRPMMNSVE